MKKAETVSAFLNSHGLLHENAPLFNIFENGDYCNEPHEYLRRDYYKIALLEGKSRLSWQVHDVTIDRPALVFYSPMVPFSWSPISKEQPGFFCLFKKEFLNDIARSESWLRSPLFKTESHPIFFLNNLQLQYVRDIFEKMLAEIESDYPYKYELLRNYLNLIVHQALKMKPHFPDGSHKTAAERITARFLELLERQFPIDTPTRYLALTTPGDYANALSVHVNHLNHAVRTVTGRATSAHVSERIIIEAKALLKHTDWSVTEIAYSLGFAYPNYFNSFFRRKTGVTPRSMRSGAI